MFCVDDAGIGSAVPATGRMVRFTPANGSRLILRDGRRKHILMAISDNNNYLELETETGDTIKVWRRAHPRARRLRLTVASGGARVSYPEGTHPAQVFAFLRKHANWLERKLDELQLDQADPPSLRAGV